MNLSLIKVSCLKARLLSVTRFNNVPVMTGINCRHVSTLRSSNSDRPRRKKFSSVEKGKNHKGFIKANFALMFPIFESLNCGVFSRSEIEEFFSLTIKAHNHLVKNTGVKQATTTWKSIVTYCNQLVEGRNPERLFRVSTGRTDGWPKLFSHLRPIFYRIMNPENYGLTESQSVELRRLLLTLFKINRVCYDFVDLDVAGLSTRHEIPKRVEEMFIEHLDNVCRRLDPQTLDDLRALPFLSPANGPNSTPKVESADAEAYALRNSDMWKHILDYAALTDNSSVIDYIIHRSEMYQQSESFDPNKAIALRKLVAIPDKGNKSRVVAICDFFTQSLLSSLEEKVISELNYEFSEKISFFDHKGGFDTVKSLPSEVRSELISLDATNWTDNLPNRLQFLYLRHKFGHSLAQAWRGIAVDCDWNLGRTTDTVRYGRGQGMGTKGSFIIASATNTVFIDMILSNLYGDGKTHDKFYITVGDDMVIQDPQKGVAPFFEDIGVPINESKSKLSVDKNDFVEYVSRNAVNGMDYSIVSPSLIAKTRKQPFYVRTLAQHLSERCQNPFQIEDILNIMDIKDVHKERIIFLNTLFELGLKGQDSTLEVAHRPVSQKDMEADLIVILLNCFILIGDSFMKWVNTYYTREKRIAQQRILDSVAKYRAQQSTAIWEHATNNQMTVSELEVLFIAIRFTRVKDELLDEGLTKNLNSYIGDQISASTTLLNDIAKLFNLALTFDKQLVATTMRVSTLNNRVDDDVRHHKANLELFKFLNRAVDLDSSTIDIVAIEPFLQAMGLESLFKILKDLNENQFSVVLADLLPRCDLIEITADNTSAGISSSGNLPDQDI